MSAELEALGAVGFVLGLAAGIGFLVIGYWLGRTGVRVRELERESRLVLALHLVDVMADDGSPIDELARRALAEWDQAGAPRPGFPPRFPDGP